MSKEKCDHCGGVAHHKDLGLVPMTMLDSESDSGMWVKVKGCCMCGSLSEVGYTEVELKEVEERYTEFLVQNGVVTEEELRETLGE